MLIKAAFEGASASPLFAAGNTDLTEIEYSAMSTFNQMNVNNFLIKELLVAYVKCFL